MGVVGDGWYEADKDGYIWTAGVINLTQIFSMRLYGHKEKRERKKKLPKPILLLYVYETLNL